MDTSALSDTVPACVVVVLLVDFLKSHRGWGWMRLVAGPAAYKPVPGLLGAKVMGSGHEGGFTLRPSATHQGLICRFDRADAAMDFLHGEQVQAYRDRARECWGGLLAVTASRGQWDQQAWGLSEGGSAQLSSAWQQRLPPPQAQAPLAVLTRASIHPGKATAFWRHAPATQASLDAASGCLLAMGLGEAPLVRQCTFSLWQDESTMLQYAREGAHQQASAAAYRHGFFSESMFVRMRVLRMAGRWKARDFDNSLAWPEVAHG
ncbi:MAG: Spheroidene monooxygenase [Pseudomonadota bacterium]|jgi:spheroidene monooxygenase